MRSRTVREGSVGLLVLLGLGLFGTLILWLRGVQLGNQSYQVVVEFETAAGLQEGTTVRYRGVPVGKVIKVEPQLNSVDVLIAISPVDLIMPRNVVIEANQSGLVSTASIDINPQVDLVAAEIRAKPLESNCPQDVIICHQARLSGQLGVNFDQMIGLSTKFTETYSDPELVGSIKSIAENMAVASQEIPQLTRDLASLTQTAKVELGSLSGSVRQELGALNEAVGTQLGVVASGIHGMSVTTQDSAKTLTSSAVVTANSVAQLTQELNVTARQLNNLLETNRLSVVNTFDNINEASEELREVVERLSPIVGRVEQGKLLDNLEILSENAAVASTNLRLLSNSVNEPGNQSLLILLEETIDSARETLESVQKLTTDLEDFTGDDKFREDLKRLINGLSGLFSSTQQLERQAVVMEELESLSTNLNSKVELSELNLEVVKLDEPLTRFMEDQDLQDRELSNQYLVP